MHESTNPHIRFHIDNIEQTESDLISITGWILHSSKKIASLAFADQDFNFYEVHYSRPDVKDVYSHTPTDKVGFKVNLSKHSCLSPVTVRLEDSQEIKIGSLMTEQSFLSVETANIHNRSTLSLPTDKFGFGNYKKNIIIVDNFYDDPDGIREYAINNLTYEETDYHKGARSKERFIIDGTKERLEKLIGKRITSWDYPGSANGKFQYCKATDPLVYHVDLQNYAGLVFLTPDAPIEAGTASYKSKFTGVRKFNQPIEDEDLYFKTFSGRSNEMNFYDGSSFELVDRVGNIYNRLVLFDSTSIHAATQYFGDSIENARFFQLFFFDVDFNADIT